MPDSPNERFSLESSLTKRLQDAGVIEPPGFVGSACAYETVTGSVAYGIATKDSDLDVHGFCIPPATVVFPHLRGEIPDFGRQKQGFRQFQCHGMEWDGDDIDLTIYSIVRFFHLCMDNNPNHIETLFTPERCVLHINSVGEMVRDRRRIFLHKGSYHRFRGFAYSQISKMRKKDRSEKRLRKYAYHAVRLLDAAGQILRTGNYIVDDNVDKLTAVRAGDWPLEDVSDYFDTKETELDELYKTSDALPHSPDENQIKQLLLDCLEEWWGSLDGIIKRPS